MSARRRAMIAGMITRRRLYRGLVSVVMPALIGAAFGTASALLVFRYQQATTQESVRTAFAGEIEAILVAIRGPARRAALAWERGERFADYKFYYPRAVFDGNVAQLGVVRDKKLVRDITYLYATLEQAREEGRRLEAGVSDKEGMLRYVHFLCSAFAFAIGLVNQLTGEMPKVTYGTRDEERRFNTLALEEDLEFLKKITAKTGRALFEPPSSQPEKRQ